MRWLYCHSSFYIMVALNLYLNLCGVLRIETEKKNNALLLAWRIKEKRHAKLLKQFHCLIISAFFSHCDVNVFDNRRILCKPHKNSSFFSIYLSLFLSLTLLAKNICYATDFWFQLRFSIHLMSMLIGRRLDESTTEIVYEIEGNIQSKRTQLHELLKNW